MRWNGAGWESIPISADGNFDTNPYVAALMDLTENAPNGTFMNLLVRDLIAKTAMITELASHLLEIQDHEGRQGAVFGGQRFVKNAAGTGVVDNDPTGENGLAGFLLGTDGILRAAQADLQTVTIRGNSKFYGEINSPVFVVNQERIYADSVRASGTNMDIRTFIIEECNYWGLDTNVSQLNLTKDVEGYYEGEDIKEIHYYLYNGRSSIDMSYIEFTSINGDKAIADYTGGAGGKISNLQFRYATLSGWKVQMNNLPTSNPFAAGVVWRDGTDLKISNG
jgi:hypothetical protein